MRGFLVSRATLAAVMLLSSVLGQQTAKKLHSWDLMMNSPEARDEGKELLGHCGDAQNQAAMNACFALEFKNADQEMNNVYREIMNELTEQDERHRVRFAQLAWLKYRDLHCETAGNLQVGAGSLEPTVVLGCKAELTRARMRDMQRDYKQIH